MYVVSFLIFIIIAIIRSMSTEVKKRTQIETKPD